MDQLEHAVTDAGSGLLKGLALANQGRRLAADPPIAHTRWTCFTPSGKDGGLGARPNRGFEPLPPSPSHRPSPRVSWGRCDGELANETDDAQRRRAMLTFVIVGGNYTGVEIAGEFNEFLTAATRLYSNIGREDIRIVLVDHEPRGSRRTLC